MRDPLLLLTGAVGASLLLTVLRSAITGEPMDKELITMLGSTLGILATALGTRKKGGDDDHK